MPHKLRFIVTLILGSLLLPLPGAVSSSYAQSKQTKPAVKKGAQPAKPVSELAKLRAEYVAATKDYKASLEKLLALYEKNVTRAETTVTQSKTLFSEGLISKHQLEESEQALADANDKVTQARLQLTNADTQIASTLLEAEAETKLARSGTLAKGALVRTAAYIRYNGSSSWSLSEAWKVQRFFQENFQRALPIGVFGQGAIHDRWRLDHRNAMDLSLHPDSAEGQALINFLRANGIPFLAFRQAIPGTATGPHIHVGRPSHRY